MTEPRKKKQTQVQEKVAVDHFAGEGGVVLPTEIKQKIDELVVLDIEVAAMKPTLDKHKKLKEELASLANDDTVFPDKSGIIVLTGFKGEIEYSPAANAREITDKNGLIGAIKTKVGYDALVEIIKIGLGDVDKYLSTSESVKFIKETFGSRSMKSARLKK